MLGRQFEMPTDHPAGCTVRPGGGNVFMSRLIPQAFFERTGRGLSSGKFKALFTNFLC